MVPIWTRHNDPSDVAIALYMLKMFKKHSSTVGDFVFRVQRMLQEFTATSAGGGGVSGVDPES